MSIIVLQASASVLLDKIYGWSSDPHIQDITGAPSSKLNTHIAIASIFKRVKHLDASGQLSKGLPLPVHVLQIWRL